MSEKAFLTRTPEFDSGHFFVDRVPSMTEEARAVTASLNASERQARNYRGVLVDVSVYAVNPVTGETGTFTGANTKPTRKSIKVCAEKRGLEKARKSGVTEAVGMVIAASTGKKENEGILNVATRSLWPCRECRDEFAVHPLVREDTVIVAVGQDRDTYQVATYGELRDLFAEAAEEPGRLEDMASNYGFDNWEKRVSMYDNIAAAEVGVPEELRRPIGQLVQLALRATLA